MAGLQRDNKHPQDLRGLFLSLSARSCVFVGALFHGALTLVS